MKNSESVSLKRVSIAFKKKVIIIIIISDSRQWNTHKGLGDPLLAEETFHMVDCV